MLRNSILFLLLVMPWVAYGGDPTRPPNLAPAAQEILHEPLHLSLILADDQRRRAVINGKVLAVSDWIGDAQVKTIGRDQVVMQRAGQRIVLKLPLSAIKKQTKGGQNE